MAAALLALIGLVEEASAEFEQGLELPEFEGSGDDLELSACVSSLFTARGFEHGQMIA